MTEWITFLIVCIYFSTASVLWIYGLNCYVMIWLFNREKDRAEIERKKISISDIPDAHWPMVTTQLPVYNEYNVAERVIRATCDMTYPTHKHHIQILDDSTDETSALIDTVVTELKEKGHHIEVVRRSDRTGYKAGALSEGMTKKSGDFIAIFDADFVPPADFLLKTIPYFLKKEKLGLVQARWGHLNQDASLLTRAQAIGIDGHFMVEQSARNWGGLYMNFNGTAGVWRKEAIIDGGGWQWDTLTEDMDLSYRVQFKGWETLYLPDLVVPAEIPEDINAFKSQQFRWAKGSMETAIKLLPGLFARKDVSLFKKIEAFFHMTHYLVHPMMVIIAILALPVMYIIGDNGPGMVLFTFAALVLILAMSAPSTLYIVSQRAAYPSAWKKNVLYLPMLIIVGTGIALSNSRAIFEAFLRIKSGFIRTPKKGDAEKRAYTVKIPVAASIEIILGLYCLVSLMHYLVLGKYVVGPFLFAYAAGFLLTGLLTFIQSYSVRAA